jgi:hypothetical protein
MVQFPQAYQMFGPNDAGGRLFTAGPVSDMTITSVDIQGSGNLAWAVGERSSNTGRGKHLGKHGDLGRFLAAIQSGTVSNGSILIAENLGRRWIIKDTSGQEYLGPLPVVADRVRPNIPTG